MAFQLWKTVFYAACLQYHCAKFGQKLLGFVMECYNWVVPVWVLAFGINNYPKGC